MMVIGSVLKVTFKIIKYFLLVAVVLFVIAVISFSVASYGSTKNGRSLTSDIDKMFNSTPEDVIPNIKNSNTVPCIPEGSEESFGSNGGSSGLDIMDIDKIKSKGYVKDYLSILKENEEGKLDKKSKFTLSVRTALGIINAENGPYTESGGMLPSSVLPWDASAKAPYSKDGVSLRTYSATTKNRIGIHPKAAVNGLGYVSPMQINSSYFSDPSFYASSYVGEGHEKSANRKPDMFYFPDQLTVLNTLASAGYAKVNFDKLTDVEKSILASNQLSAGNIWVYQQAGFPKNSNPSKDELTVSLKELASYYEKGYSKYSAKLDLTSLTHSDYKWAAVIILCEQGWWLAPDSRLLGTAGDHRVAYDYINDNRKNAHRVWKKMGKEGSESDMMSYFKGRVKSKPGGYPYSAGYGVMWVDTGKYSHVHTIETAGHNLAVGYSGPYMYNNMLKTLGEDLDVGSDSVTNGGTNDTTGDGNQQMEPRTGPKPATRNLPQAYLDGGVDPDRLSDISLKIFDAAYYYNGSPYAQVNPPSRNGIDCSGLALMAYKKGLGIDIPRVAAAQQSSDLFVDVSIEDAKVGDLMFKPDRSHVVIFAGIREAHPNGTYTVDYYHAPRPGKVVSFSKDTYGPSGSGATYHLIRTLSPEQRKKIGASANLDNSVTGTNSSNSNSNSSNLDDCVPEDTDSDSSSEGETNSNSTSMSGQKLAKDKEGADKTVNFKSLGKAPDLKNPTKEEKIIYDIASKQVFNLPANYPGFVHKYGPRVHPITSKRSNHTGLDIGLPLNYDVLASKSGVVYSSGNSSDSYGEKIVLYHGNGEWTMYAHNNKRLVKAGDIVNRGDHIAECGTTGMSTGTHIHFELWKGAYGAHVDPALYVDGFYDKNNSSTIGDRPPNYYKWELDKFKPIKEYNTKWSR